MPTVHVCSSQDICHCGQALACCCSSLGRTIMGGSTSSSPATSAMSKCQMPRDPGMRTGLASTRGRSHSHAKRVQSCRLQG